LSEVLIEFAVLGEIGGSEFEGHGNLGSLSDHKLSLFLEQGSTDLLHLFRGDVFESDQNDCLVGGEVAVDLLDEFNFAFFDLAH
jgi:hypothetical protein